MSKKPQDSTNLKLGASDALAQGDLLSRFNLRQSDRTKKPGFVEQLAQDLYTWGLEETSDDIHEFYFLVNADYLSFARWRKKFPLLEQTYKEVKTLIGIRQRRNAATRLHDKDVVFKTLHYFHPDHERLVKEEEVKREKAEKEKEKIRKETLAREERHRLEDKAHQEKMAMLRAQQEQGALDLIQKHLEKVVLTLPELNDKDRNNVSTGDNKETPTL